MTATEVQRSPDERKIVVAAVKEASSHGVLDVIREESKMALQLGLVT